jgi:hypothetical protein
VADRRLVTVTVVYERRARCAPTLEWIAPELKDAGLSLIEDHHKGSYPSRMWAGSVDGPAFARFADAWQLGDECSEPTSGSLDAHAYTFDRMNWKTGGESPIVSVTIQVGAAEGAYRARQRHPLPFTYIG